MTAGRATEQLRGPASRSAEYSHRKRRTTRQRSGSQEMATSPAEMPRAHTVHVHKTTLTNATSDIVTASTGKTVTGCPASWSTPTIMSWRFDTSATYCTNANVTHQIPSG